MGLCMNATRIFIGHPATTLGFVNEILAFGCLGLGALALVGGTSCVVYGVATFNPFLFFAGLIAIGCGLVGLLMFAPFHKLGNVFQKLGMNCS